MLFRHGGHIGAAMVLGGVDPAGFHLYTIYPHGSTDKLPFVTMGSGSLAAMAIFESGWKPNMEVNLFQILFLRCLDIGSLRKAWPSSKQLSQLVCSTILDQVPTLMHASSPLHVQR